MIFIFSPVCGHLLILKLIEEEEEKRMKIKVSD